MTREIHKQHFESSIIQVGAHTWAHPEGGGTADIGVCIGVCIGAVIAVPSGLYIGVCIGVYIGPMSVGKCEQPHRQN